MRFRQLLPLFSALFALYIIWGSTYFVIRIGVESWPPLMMAGVRFLSAGILLTTFLLLRGHKLPPLRQLLNAALIGILLLAVGNGLVTVAEHQDVPSGIAAVVVATVPLFTLCFSHFFGIKTRKLEWTGIAIGLAGIIMLNSGGNLSGNPWGALLILIGSMSWAFGSVFGARIAKPQHVSPIALHIFTDFVQPELGTRGGNFEQVAVVMMPETAVREDNAAILIHDKIRASGQRGVLHMKRHPLLLQQTGKAFFYRRIARGYRPHILAARRLIVYVRHAGSLSGAM